MNEPEGGIARYRRRLGCDRSLQYWCRGGAMGEMKGGGWVGGGGHRAARAHIVCEHAPSVRRAAPPRK